MMHIWHWLEHAPWSFWYLIWHVFSADGGHALVVAGHYSAVGLAGAGAVLARRFRRKRKWSASTVNLEHDDEEDRWQWWLVIDGGQPQMVSRKKWVQAEREHGFRPAHPHKPDTPATMSWDDGRSRGYRIRK